MDIVTKSKDNEKNDKSKTEENNAKENIDISNNTYSNMEINYLDKKSNEKIEEYPAEYSFKFIEVILFIKFFKIFNFIQIFKCKKIRKKYMIHLLQKNIMKEKMNISLYIHNMLYLDTFKDIAEEDKDHIFKFLDEKYHSSKNLSKKF